MDVEKSDFAVTATSERARQSTWGGIEDCISHQNHDLDGVRFYCADGSGVSQRYLDGKMGHEL